MLLNLAIFQILLDTTGIVKGIYCDELRDVEQMLCPRPQTVTVARELRDEALPGMHMRKHLPT